MTNYYQILGVSVHATQGEIKFAHRQLIKKFHPDLTKQPHNLTMINLVNEAYQILSNQESRSLYDQKYFFTPNQRELSSVFNEDWVNFQTGKNDRNLNPEQYHPEEEISSDHQQIKGLNKENQSIYQDDNLKENILSSQKTGDWLGKQDNFFIKKNFFGSEFDLPKQKPLIQQLSKIYGLSWKEVLSIMDNTFLSKKEIFYRCYHNLSYFDNKQISLRQLQAELFHKAILQQDFDYLTFVKIFQEEKQRLNIHAKLLVAEKKWKQPIKEILQYYVFTYCESCWDNRKLSLIINCLYCNNLRYLKIMMGLCLTLPPWEGENQKIVYPKFGNRSQYLIGDLIIEVVNKGSSQGEKTEFFLQYGDLDITIEQLNRCKFNSHKEEF